MKSNSVLIVGCGDLGIRTGALLQRRGWQIAGLRRDSACLPGDFAAYGADYVLPASLDFIESLEPDYVLAIFNPTQRTVAGYQAGFAGAMANLLSGLGSHRPRHVIAISSSRVFAEQQGSWVDESSALSGDDRRASAIIEAEQLLLSSPHPSSVVRFAGIYGLPNGRLVTRVLCGELCTREPLRYSNRIHREDCAGFLAHLLLMAQAGEPLSPIYLGVDNEPAPQYEVERWLARELGVNPGPGETPLPECGPGGHKRCRNKLLRDTGYPLRYPDYRSGYRAVIDARQYE